jgi:hypothetical protein
MSAAHDCQTCGACCRSPWTSEAYVRLYDVDLERLAGTGVRVVFQEQGSNGDEPVEVVPKLVTTFDDRGLRVCASFVGRVGERCGCGVRATPHSLPPVRGRRHPLS